MERIVVLGSLNIDLVAPVDRLPREGETLAGGDLRLFGGGKGANQAAAAARLGGDVVMIGQVGSDAFGDRLTAGLAAFGVDVSGVGRSSRSTGSACIYVMPGGENAIVISPGANATVTPDIVMSRLSSARPYRFLLAQLEIPIEAVISAFAESRNAGAVTILDPAPYRSLPAELIRLADIVTPNQSEAAALLGCPAGAPIDSIEAASRAAAQLRAAGCRGVILKLGSLGCYVDTPDGRGAIPPFAVEATDTTAAGDTFNAALAVSLARGAAIMDSSLFANAAAAISVTRPGAQSSIPSAAEVEEFLRERRTAACSL
ncbi:MAG TPA: ribokinase [Bryobacteraceae bacterium]|jgi:ribokinase|nr:ribokinase [Bryobacteraceae bacterium]